MAEPKILEALELLYEHVNIGSDARARLRAALDGKNYGEIPPPPPDPRDEQIKALQAQLAAKNAPAAEAEPVEVAAE